MAYRHDALQISDSVLVAHNLISKHTSNVNQLLSIKLYWTRSAGLDKLEVLF